MPFRPSRNQWPWLVVISIIAVVAIVGALIAKSDDPQTAKTSGLLVALGDSYASGEGLVPFDAGSDTSTDRCHRSVQAYPTVAAAELKMSVRNVSCSGAKIGTLVAGLGGEPSQLSALADATAVTVMIGGNDIDALGSVISLPTAQEVRSRLDKLSTPLADVYIKVKKAAPHAKVYALSYPNLVVDATTPPAGCAFDTAQLATLVNGAKDLASVIQDAAGKAGVGYIDLVGALKDHELCSGAPWINGLNLANLDASLHPTADGQRQLANVVTATIKAGAS